MSYVRICDTCPPETATRIELDPEDPNAALLPEGWTVDDLDRESCPFCNAKELEFEAGQATQEDGQAFVKELKKETRKLNKAKKEAANGE